MALGSNLVVCLFLLLEICPAYSLCMVYGCFYATVEELSTDNRSYVAQKVESIYFLTFAGKNKKQEAKLPR